MFNSFDTEPTIQELDRLLSQVRQSIISNPLFESQSQNLASRCNCDLPGKSSHQLLVTNIEHPISSHLTSITLGKVIL